MQRACVHPVSTAVSTCERNAALFHSSPMSAAKNKPHSADQFAASWLLTPHRAEKLVAKWDSKVSQKPKQQPPESAAPPPKTAPKPKEQVLEYDQEYERELEELKRQREEVRQG